MTLENLNNVDQKILRFLLENAGKGQASRVIAFKLEVSQPYVIMRIQHLQDRGLVLRDKKGRTVNWRVNPKLIEEIARSLPKPPVEAAQDAAKAEAARFEAQYNSAIKGELK